MVEIWGNYVDIEARLLYCYIVFPFEFGGGGREFFLGSVMCYSRTMLRYFTTVCLILYEIDHITYVCNTHTHTNKTNLKYI